MTIYVVMGSTGEYSDRTDWPVKAFRTDAAAAELVIAASARANAIEQAKDRYASVPKGANEHDPEMQMDYTGTSYSIMPVELEDR